MMLWVVFALMTAAALLAVLWPLGRGARAQATASDVAVYQDQLAEVDRDRAADRIAEPEAEAARVEVSRRLLAAADAARTREAPVAVPWRRRAAAIATIVVLPLGALALYLALGSPQRPGEPLAGRQHERPEERSLASLIAQVEAHLARNPEDGRGWEVLAPVYMRLGRFDEAVTARRNVLRLLGPSVTREADLGEALTAQADGVVTAPAKESFERALAIDPNDTRSRFFIGLAAEQDGRGAEAAAVWRDLIAKAPPGAPWVTLVQESLSRVEGGVSASPAASASASSASTPSASTPSASTPSASGPSEQDIAAASELTPEQRTDMIRGMVERLAERLTRDGSDVDGWLRLVRAYTVLGDRDKARAAAADARRALASDPDKLRRVDDLVKGLGLEG